MNNQPYAARHTPCLNIDTSSISARLRELASTGRCEQCEVPLTAATADIAQLLTEVGRLYLALKRERFRSANLEAAIRAALGASADGEPDPLAYLRDELPGYIRGWCR